MHVKILGSAAGGGFPQWNCACPNCRALRATGQSSAGVSPAVAGTSRPPHILQARNQTQVAISADSKTWFLLGASPDLRAQIESTSELQPRGSADDAVRQSPIVGAVLLNADIDHVVGLLLLRELQPLRVYATESIRQILSEDNSMLAMLQRVPNQLIWIAFQPGKRFALHDPAGNDSGMHCRALSLGVHFPSYVSEQRRSQLNPNEASLGLIVESPSGKRLAYMPAVPQLTAELLKEFDSADLLLFDGTFWSDDELIRVQGSGQTALQMGHVAVASPAGSLSQLAQVRRPRKIYIHINNTNPMLNEAGPEYRQVRDAGWELAEDGWQVEL